MTAARRLAAILAADVVGYSRLMGEDEAGTARAVEANRNFPVAYFSLAAALAQLGRLDEAHSAVKAGLALDPNFTVSRARASWTAMSDDPTYLAALRPTFDGMRKAGVPEQ